MENCKHCESINIKLLSSENQSYACEDCDKVSTNTIYSVIFGIVHSELANFENGCNPSTSKGRFLDEPMIFEASTLKELLREVKKVFNVSQESLLLNSCDEMGRLDVQTYSKTLDGLRDTYNIHKSGFRSGSYDLWLNDITGKVTKTTIPDLKHELAQDKALENIIKG